MAYKQISDYGLIGDMHSCALVGLDGSIDWCCFPRFDSPSIFAAILDDAKGGRFQIAPAQSYESTQRYTPHTNILETTFTTATGQATVVDFMPLSETRRPGRSPHEIYRLVRCDRGTVRLSCLFDPRFDYARASTQVKAVANGVIAWSDQDSVTLSAQHPFLTEGTGASSEIPLQEGEETTLVLSYGRTRPVPLRNHDSRERLVWTRDFWEALVASIRYDGLWQEEVVRSFLVLHLLMYSPSGAIIAAPTTSLPEEVGGQRNWDYRYSWLRDGAWTLGILYRLGHVDEGRSFINWLVYRYQMSMEDIPVVYGIAPDSDLSERTLDHLEGYKGSRPVRIGNEAATHVQLDVFGEVVLSIATHYKHTGLLSSEMWSLVERFAEAVCQNWHRADRGIWEVRSERHHFVYSKIMCWVALDRAIKLAEATGKSAPVERWREVAYTIKAQVLERGWSQRKHSFVQHYDTEALDASNLILPFVGFLPPEDPRIRSTVERTMEELAQGPFVQRYKIEETSDGLSGSEGAFTLLTFWLIGSLISCGQVERARALFQETLTHANHLGLFSEMIDPKTGEALGNFPQAFSHIGLIHTARNLSQPLQRAWLETVLA